MLRNVSAFSRGTESMQRHPYTFFRDMKIAGLIPDGYPAIIFRVVSALQ